MTAGAFIIGRPTQQTSSGQQLPFYEDYNVLPTSASIGDLAISINPVGTWMMNVVIGNDYFPRGIYRYELVGTQNKWRWLGPAEAIQQIVTNIGDGGTSFSTATMIDYTDEYTYFLINADAAWQINRYAVSDNARTVATVSNNAGITTANAAWAAHTTLTYG